MPFWTFFGATLIGKAVIKMHIQVGLSALEHLAFIMTHLSQPDHSSAVLQTSVVGELRRSRVPVRVGFEAHPDRLMSHQMRKEEAFNSSLDS